VDLANAMLVMTSLAFLACASNILISVVSSCLYYTELYHLQPTPYFATQLNAGLQVVVCGVVLGALELSSLAPRRDEQPIRLRSWMELSLLFTVQNALEIASIDGLGPESGSLTTILQQAVVPLTLVASRLLLNRRYSALHFVAAATVVCGIIGSYYAPTITISGSRIWILCFVASRVPQALANVRSESIVAARQHIKPSASASVQGSSDSADDWVGVVGDRGIGSHGPSNSGGSGGVDDGSKDLDGDTEGARSRATWDGLRTVVRAGFWTALFALLFNPPTSLLLAAGEASQPALEALLSDYSDGAACVLWGTLANGTVTERCTGALGAVGAFAAPGALFSVSEFLVLQQTSAATYFVLVALQLPLEAGALSFRPLMGTYTSRSQPSLLYGVPVIVTGLLLWTYAEHSRASPRTVLATPTAPPRADHLPRVPSIPMMASTGELRTTLLAGKRASGGWYNTLFGARPEGEEAEA
jgi:hypothetical protein